MLRIQTKPAVGKHSTESLRTVFGGSYLFTVCPLPPVALVIIQLCVCECVCSLDYSDIDQCACAGSEITIAVSSDVRHGV